MNPSRDPIGYAANRRQAAAWIAEDEEVVIPRLRPLRMDRETFKAVETPVNYAYRG